MKVIKIYLDLSPSIFLLIIGLGNYIFYSFFFVSNYKYYAEFMPLFIKPFFDFFFINYCLPEYEMFFVYKY